jgi:hypothetical protein
MNNKEKFNKTLLIAAVITLIILIVVIWWYQSNQSSETNENYSRTTPGPTNQECTSNADCAGVCGNDKCLVASCTKSVGSSTGKCSCLGICN